MSAAERFHERGFRLLQMAALAVLLGRAWQLFFQGNPLLSLCYDQRFAKPIIEGFFQIDWAHFQANSTPLIWVENGISAIGGFFLLTSLILLFIRSMPLFLVKMTTIISSLFLVLLALAYYVDKGFALGQFIEYALQMGSPALLYFFYKKNYPKSRFFFSLKILIALTFVGHGLYAIGYYPQPGHFVQMMIDGFGMSENIAKLTLQGFGLLDFIAVVLLFLPFGKWQKISLYYCIIWGFLTAFARLYTNFYVDFPLDVLLEWLPDFLYRMPHFLIPLLLLIFSTKDERGVVSTVKPNTL